jgi:hypothetical protein
MQIWETLIKGFLFTFVSDSAEIAASNYRAWPGFGSNEWVLLDQDSVAVDLR